MLSAQLAAAVSDTIDNLSDELVCFLQQLIQIPSESPEMTDTSPDGESLVQDCIGRALAELDCELDRWEALPGRPNLVARLPGAGQGRSLLFNGHIDVVPTGPIESWPRPPWAGTIADGAVWGRGACDMKGGVAAMVYAAIALRRLGLHLAGDLFIESVIGEETGGQGTRSAIERGYRTDFVVVTESTGLKVLPVAGGLEWVRLIVTGRSGHQGIRYRSIHAGGQGASVNALEKGAWLLDTIQGWERARAANHVHPLLPAGLNTIGPGVMAAGCGRGPDGLPAVTNAVANVPDYCVIDFDFKYLPDQRPAEARAEFEQLIHDAAQLDDWLRSSPPTIQWGLHGVSFPPVNTPAEHPGVRALVAASQAAGIESPVEGFDAVADTAWFAERSIPCVLFGPGSGAGAHATDEHIEIDQLILGTKILALMALDWCGVEGSPSR